MEGAFCGQAAGQCGRRRYFRQKSRRGLRAQKGRRLWPAAVGTCAGAILRI